MILRRLRYKLLLAVGIAVALGLAGTAAFYTYTAEEVIVSQHSRTLHKLTEAVAMGLESMMLEGHAELGQEYAARLRNVPEVKDLRIVRADGIEAFRDNRTIRSVNAKLGKPDFQERATEDAAPVIRADHPDFLSALSGSEAVLSRSTDEKGHHVVTFLDPIFNERRCHRCHDEDASVRGVVMITTPLDAVERDVHRARVESLTVLAAALMFTMLLTGYMLGRAVLKPIETLTGAIARVAGGDLLHRVPVTSADEVGAMARSFNAMTADLKSTYDGLRREQDKLTTIIQGAREAIVVTDAGGAVVLVNPAAENLLGKDARRIAAEGFQNLLDDPALIRRVLSGRTRGATETVSYNGHIFQLAASSILDGQGQPIGSAALLRDITEEKRLEEELRRLSTTDALTGLFNRRYLDEAMRREMNRTRHTGAALSIIMFDVDHFKRFNDQHGHDQGDRVLQVVADIMRQALRAYDIPCRYGGEEFLAILPSTDSSGAACVAERLRHDVENTPVDGLRVTISLGVATFPEVDAPGGDALIAIADDALYKSKQGGRNRVTVSGAAKPVAAVATA